MFDQLLAAPIFWLFSTIIVATFLLSSYAAFISVRNKKHLQIQKSESAKQWLMLQTGVQGIGSRVLELENRLANLRKSQDDLSHANQDLAYSKARNLIDEGMSDDAIAETSGLTVSEVSLMKLVHRTSNTSGYVADSSQAFSGV